MLWLGLAAHSPSAGAEEARTPAVWYRAAAECPLGPDFLAKIDGTPRAHLALAGEHIDFIVTLLTSGNETVGRLERQTNGGTVAIRELRDATRARVPDGLALRLGLALDPAQPSAASAAEPAPPEPSRAETAAPANAPVEIAAPPKPAPLATAPAPAVGSASRTK